MVLLVVVYWEFCKIQFIFIRLELLQRCKSHDLHQPLIDHNNCYRATRIQSPEQTRPSGKLPLDCAE